jgi:hypothetical protein
MESRGRCAGLEVGVLRFAIVFLAVAFLQLFGDNCFAGDVFGNPVLQDDTSSSISRDEWREKVAKAKRRAQQTAIEQRGRVLDNIPSKVDDERLASERILNDDSLQSGDIVSTNKGLFVFKGRLDRERRDTDFVAVPLR